MHAAIKKGKGKKSKQFTFTLHGKNGKVIGKASEFYTRKAKAKQTLARYFDEFVVIDTTKKNYKAPF